MARRKARTKRLMIRINAVEKLRLEKVAAGRDVPVSWVVRDLIKRLTVNTPSQGSER